MRIRDWISDVYSSDLRQTPIRGALTAMAAIARHADIVVLTNVGPDHQAARAAQLSALGLDAPVIGSRGGKGEPVRRLLDERQPSVAIFIDALAGHHPSVAADAPEVWRLQMVGEPAIAARAEARRVEKEGVSQGRSRG